MSANYLSTLLQQVAGMADDQLQQFLAAMYQQLPVINTVGYIDRNNNYYSHGQASDYTNLLNVYSRIEYNNLLDTDNRDDSLFYLNTGSALTMTVPPAIPVRIHPEIQMPGTLQTMLTAVIKTNL